MHYCEKVLGKKTSLISFYFTGNVEKIRDSIYRNMHVNSI